MSEQQDKKEITDQDLAEVLKEESINFLSENRGTIIKRAQAKLRKRFKVGQEK